MSLLEFREMIESRIPVWAPFVLAGILFAGYWGIVAWGKWRGR